MQKPKLKLTGRVFWVYGEDPGVRKMTLRRDDPTLPPEETLVMILHPLAGGREAYEVTCEH